MIARPALPAPVRPDVGASTAHRYGTATLVVALGTACALLWVTIANDLATRGLRINEMIGRRQDLTMQRAGARVALGIASDPRRLAERAVQLGYGPPDDVAIVIATVDDGATFAPQPFADVPDADSPLALWLAGVQHGDARVRPWYAQLMAIDGWQAQPQAAAP